MKARKEAIFSSVDLQCYIESAQASFIENEFYDAIRYLEIIEDFGIVDLGALSIKGAALVGLNEIDQAICAYKKAMLLAPYDAKICNNLGVCYLNNDQISKALREFKKAELLAPDYPSPTNNIGDAFQRSGQYDEAIKFYLRALKKSPESSKIQFNLGNAYNKLGKKKLAIEAFLKALAIDWTCAQTHNNLGTVYSEIGDIDNALNSFKSAASLSPNYVNAFVNLGGCYHHKGMKELALECYDKVISFDPSNGLAHRLKSLLLDYSLEEPHFNFMLSLRDSFERDASPENSAHFQFALGKAYSDKHDFYQAFKFLKHGNSLRAEQIYYNKSSEENYFEMLIESQKRLPNFDVPDMLDDDHLVPIFIVGLPRSGTTLVEQILSTHPDVEAFGEMNELHEFGLYRLGQNTGGLEVSEFLTIKTKYLDRIKHRLGGKMYFTDKMPHNFRYLGALRQMFPRCKFVHLQRSPMAVAWSNFETYFTSDYLSYSLNMSDIFHYYELYLKLMSSWNLEVSESIINLKYEDLCESPDRTIRNLLDQIGLTWYEGCLQPHLHNRVVLTASQQQVKQEIFTGSSNRWRKFLPFIQEEVERDVLEKFISMSV